MASFWVRKAATGAASNSHDWKTLNRGESKDARHLLAAQARDHTRNPTTPGRPHGKPGREQRQPCRLHHRGPQQRASPPAAAQLPQLLRLAQEGGHDLRIDDAVWSLLAAHREAAARYSFLLAIPAVMASGFYQLYRSWEIGSPVPPGPTALATLIAFGVGYGVIVWFLKLVSTRGYMPFVWYRIGLGVLVFALLGAGVLGAT